MSGHFFITPDPIDIPELIKLVEEDKVGAIASFQGVTRNYNADRQVVKLVYEAYEDMALKLMRQVFDEAKKKFDFHKMVISHRTGVVAVRETSVFIAVSAGHRGTAFDACRFAIDRLKEIVPIWKKEVFENNQIEWIANNENIGKRI